VISAYREPVAGESPREIPTTGLMAYWCAPALMPRRYEPFLWLAAISLLFRLGREGAFCRTGEAKKLYGAGALRDVTSLLNAPRRAARGDGSSALQLLLLADSPKEILTSEDPRVGGLRADLVAAKEEVAVLATARKQPPRFSKAVREELGPDLVAMMIDSACQVHPLLALRWRARFPKSVVFGVNTGFRPDGSTSPDGRRRAADDRRVEEFSRDVAVGCAPQGSFFLRADGNAGNEAPQS
jgi:single-stranded-DNA-specific exonuclease